MYKGMKYRIIYIDPPWKMKNGSVPWRDGSGSVSDHYDCMDSRDMMHIDIRHIADPKSCVMFMWCTSPTMREALDLMQAWGFKFKTVAFVWVKTTKDDGIHGGGMGYYTRISSEFVLMGVMGDTPERLNKSVNQIVFAPRTVHSEKPHIIRHRITELFGDLLRIEIFSRHEVPGWDRFGSDIGDIRDWLPLKDVKEIVYQCKECEDVYKFYLQEGEQFFCPSCGVQCEV